MKRENASCFSSCSYFLYLICATFPKTEWRIKAANDTKTAKTAKTGARQLGTYQSYLTPKTFPTSNGGQNTGER